MLHIRVTITARLEERLGSQDHANRADWYNLAMALEWHGHAQPNPSH